MYCSFLDAWKLSLDLFIVHLPHATYNPILCSCSSLARRSFCEGEFIVPAPVPVYCLLFIVPVSCSCFMFHAPILFRIISQIVFAV